MLMRVGSKSSFASLIGEAPLLLLPPLLQVHPPDPPPLRPKEPERPGE